MSSFDQLANELAKQLSEQITAEVLKNVRLELSSAAKNNFEFCFSEKEAAGRLKISEVTLRRKRDAKVIDFSRVGGRVVYMPHHLLDYLIRNEVRNGKQAVGLNDVLNFPALKKAA